MKKHLDIVDFLRGFSIFTIVLMHLLQSYQIPNILYKIFSFGGAGVHVFILCSGFGLYLSYLYKPLEYKDFLKRRFTKVYLPYIIVIFISALIPFYNTSEDKWFQLLSHVFLFKMFDETLESSYGGQMWFVSTIIQFYVFWPLIVRLFKCKYSMIISLLISILWATVVGLTDHAEQRIWNSFFLQYLWEFILGMHLAKLYYNAPQKITVPSFKILIPVCVVAMALTFIMALKGGFFKLYNDIPSLAGYLFLSLILYKVSIKWVNKYFIYTNKISYEWYLIHILIFACCKHFLRELIPVYVIIPVQLISSYFFAYCYEKLLKTIRVK